MQIADIITSDLIQFGADVKTKKKALQYISQILVAHHNELNEKEIYHSLLARERLGSTFVGHGVAIPHCKNEHATDPIACIVRLKNYIDFSITNEQQVNIIIGLVLPIDHDKEHVQILAKIAALIDNQKFRDTIYTTQNPYDILKALDQYSKEH